MALNAIGQIYSCVVACRTGSGTDLEFCDKFASQRSIKAASISPVDGIVAEILKRGEGKESVVGPHEEVDIISFVYSEFTET